MQWKLENFSLISQLSLLEINMRIIQMFTYTCCFCYCWKKDPKNLVSPFEIKKRSKKCLKLSLDFPRYHMRWEKKWWYTPLYRKKKFNQHFGFGLHFAQAFLWTRSVWEHEHQYTFIIQLLKTGVWWHFSSNMFKLIVVLIFIIFHTFQAEGRSQLLWFQVISCQCSIWYRMLPTKQPFLLKWKFLI